MKYVVLALILMSFAVSGKIGWDYFKRHQQHRILGTLPTENTDLNAPVMTMKDRVGQALDLSNIDFPKQASAACVDFWKSILGTSLSDWYQQMNQLGWNRPNECQSSESASVAELAAAAKNYCVLGDAPNVPCQQAVLKYRTKLTSQIFANRRNYVDMQLTLLLNKIYGQALISGAEEAASASELFNMIDNLNKREAKLYVARKLAVLALYRAQDQETNPELKASLNQRLSSEIDQAKALQSGDPEILTLDLMRQTLATEEDSETQEQVSQDPEQDVAPKTDPQPAQPSQQTATIPINYDLNW